MIEWIYPPVLRICLNNLFSSVDKLSPKSSGFSIFHYFLTREKSFQIKETIFAVSIFDPKYVIFFGYNRIFLKTFSRLQSQPPPSESATRIFTTTPSGSHNSQRLPKHKNGQNLSKQSSSQNPYAPHLRLKTVNRHFLSQKYVSSNISRIFWSEITFGYRLLQ